MIEIMKISRSLIVLVVSRGIIKEGSFVNDNFIPMGFHEIKCVVS